MVTIRQGVMTDCKDLLEVYQGTRWFHRVREGGYTTLEQVKEEHRGAAFQRWGWLVAEERGKVVGEIVFRYEKNPVSGRVGIIRNIDIDVRNQKTSIGTKLTHAAEDVLRSKRVVRVIATTPPAAYNYWMKVNYFARGSILNIRLPRTKIPPKKSTKVKTTLLKDVKKLPKSMKFSHIAYPGSMAELAARVIGGESPGKFLEFTSAGNLIGAGVITKENANSSLFVADVTKRGLQYADVVLSRVASTPENWKTKTVRSVIPKDQIPVFNKMAKWKSETSTDIPVTRLL